MRKGLSFAVSLAASLFNAMGSSAEANHPISVTAVRLDGREVSGSLLAFDASVAQLGPGEGRAAVTKLRTSDLLSLRFAESRAGAPPSTTLEFANGDRVAAELGLLEQDAIAVRLGGAMITVPLETLRAITFRPPDDGTPAVLFRDSGEEDLVLLSNGDRLPGRVEALSSLELTLEAGGRSVRVPRERLAAIAFSPELTSAARIDGSRQIVHTRAGWLTVKGVSHRADGTWTATTAFGEPITWRGEEIVRIQFAGEQAEFLSDKDPASVEALPFLSREWLPQKDRAVTGEPLTAGGETFAKGLGVHSRCRMTYALDGAYAAFHAVAALADSAGPVGSVEFAVELDGRQVLRTGAMTHSDEPLPITNLDLTGAERLVLTVDFGENGDVRDWANWCDAVLVRRPGFSRSGAASPPGRAP